MYDCSCSGGIANSLDNVSHCDMQNCYNLLSMRITKFNYDIYTNVSIVDSLVNISSKSDIVNCTQNTGIRYSVM